MKGKEKVLAYLMEARSVIADEGSWIQCTMSENAEGDQCDPFEDNAVSFCMEGSLFRAIHHNMGGIESIHDSRILPMIESLERRLADAVFNRTENDPISVITSFNDSSYVTHKDVLKVYDRAIRNLRKELENAC